MRMKPGIWLAGFLLASVILLCFFGYNVYVTDPLFHFHTPRTDQFFYPLDNERFQNDGIVKHFDYDTIVTGPSIAENFKTTEIDGLFGTSSIKIPFAGGNFKEINDILENAVNANSDIRIIIRSLEDSLFIADKDEMSSGYDYPTYLYNRNPLDDVMYLLNRDILFSRVLPMYENVKTAHFAPGTTPFDIYSNWNAFFSYGKNAVLDPGSWNKGWQTERPMTEDEKQLLLGNLQQNVIDIVEKNPDILFYFYFPPFSAEDWRKVGESGKLGIRVESERIVIEELLKHDNIKLFSFNNRTDITTDLNHYYDYIHYGEWINSWILHYIHKGEYQLTGENYRQYLADEYDFYSTYDYDQLLTQEDYEDDTKAAVQIYTEIFGEDPFLSEPLLIDDAWLQHAELKKAVIVYDQYDGTAGIETKGTLERTVNSFASPDEHIIWNDDFCGMKLTIDDASSFRFLTFYGKRTMDNGQPHIIFYDENGNLLASYRSYYSMYDNEWHRFLVDMRGVKGKVMIVFNGGYEDVTGSQDSSYIFSNIRFY